MSLKPIAVIVLSTFPILASAQPKSSWSWSTEERLAVRFDPLAAAERVQRLATERHSTSPSQFVAIDYLDGRTQPELFLPHEILSMFLRSAYGADDETGYGFRASAQQAAEELGLPADFLKVLEREGPALIAMQQQEHALRDALSDGTGDTGELRDALKTLADEQCPARIGLLRRLQELYGADTNRFLYMALAPGMTRIVIAPATNRSELEREAGGCR